MPQPEVAARAAPPPFSRQRGRSWLLLAGLVLTIGLTVLVGLLTTVPTYATATAVVHADPAACAGLSTPPGAGGCVEVRLDPAPAERVAVGTTAQVTLPGDGVTSPVVLTQVVDRHDVGGVRGAVSAAGVLERSDRVLPAAAAVGGTATGTATVDVGRRRLALVFLGRGLVATP